MFADYRLQKAVDGLNRILLFQFASIYFLYTPIPMNITHRYQLSLALLTDMYQLTMAQGYWKKGMAEQEGVFHLYFRKNPFKGGYTVCAGLADAIDLLLNFKFSEEDLTYLRSLKGSQQQPLFEEGFLNHLRQLSFSCEVDAVPEGTVIFPNEPLLRLKGRFRQHGQPLLAA
jgi:nicotinate phosphoribosyltransferase